MANSKNKKTSKKSSKPDFPYHKKPQSKYESLKLNVYRIIQTKFKKKLVGELYDIFMVALIIADIIVNIVVTYDVSNETVFTLRVIENVTIGFFIIDYGLRLWTADLEFPKLGKVKARFKYIFSFWGIIDLLSFLPFCVQFLPHEVSMLKIFRALRLFRIFQFKRDSNALTAIFKALNARKAQLFSSVFVILILMLAASLIMYDLEHEAQPDAFPNAFSGLWWAANAIFTVGYGDVYPVTVMGQIMSIIISILGVMLVAIPTGIISSGFIEQSEQRRHESQKTYCPHCGKKL